MTFRSSVLPFGVLLLICLPAVFGQWRRQRGYDRIDRNDRWGVPDWTVDEEFSEDLFTFARVRYNGRRGRWRTDYPLSDLSVSWRLQELTSLEVHPDATIVDLDGDDIFNYPFIYMLEVGGLSLTNAEVEGLRRYLKTGGFLMVDDFWGIDEWDNFEYEIREVLPDCEIVELELDHPIFNGVFEMKEKPQVPAIEVALRGRSQGITWESYKPEAETPHYRAIYDGQGRMMVLICYNTDLGDGWEREGENRWYFKEFSEKSAYPMMINILYYAMTH